MPVPCRPKGPEAMIKSDKNPLNKKSILKSDPGCFVLSSTDGGCLAVIAFCLSVCALCVYDPIVVPEEALPVHRIGDQRVPGWVFFKICPAPVGTEPHPDASAPERADALIE